MVENLSTIDFNQVYSEYANGLLYIAFSYTHDRRWAEDIVQETFIKAFKKIDTIEDTKKVGAWLSIITARTAIDFLRSEKRNRWITVDAAQMEPIMNHKKNGMDTEEMAGIRFLQEDVGRSMESLSKEFQEVLTLKVNYDLKENEIARLLGLKSTTVKTRIYRARKQLKQVFAKKETVLDLY
ncbi:RNA polymerase sigma factor [Neobacillus drentensis]|uniref:RNA polymerase sigma factor n=1 Tax=Neobacillus drentensis TaxID=220684 RepID=UPI001F43B051|nr:RNA polymerase sigma factor [Neobacillus drentensis]ULT57641.1 RNA polymerase sigma factor [Neobacillus drentensis]